MMPELVNVDTPRSDLNGPERHRVVEVPGQREILARAVSGKACHFGGASVPLLVKLLFAGAEVRYITRSVSRPPRWSGRSAQLNVLLLKRLLSPLLNCTRKPVMRPLLVTSGVPATARSDSAPMLPPLLGSVPPVELR
jgi:hypothetical protein